MNSFSVAFSAVFPLFAMMGIGVVIHRVGMLTEQDLRKVNTLAFRVLLSTSMYYNIIMSDIGSLFNGKVLLYALASQVVVLLLSLATGFLGAKGKKSQGALAHGVYHVNYIIFGTLIATSLFGEGNLGAVTLLIAVLIPVQNVISAIMLELMRDDPNLNPKKLLMGVLKNPYVIACFLGFATKLLGITFPAPVTGVLRDLGRCGTPLALISMGGLFNFGAVREKMKSVLFGCFVKLVLIPVLLIPPAYFLGFRGADLLGLMVAFMAPCATSSFSLAAAMDSDTDMTAQIVVFSSLFSIVTTFFWIYLFTSLGALV